MLKKVIGLYNDEKRDGYTSVPQPKSKPAILTPANLTPPAVTTDRAAPKATIEPARSFEMECIVARKKRYATSSNECGRATGRQQH